MNEGLALPAAFLAGFFGSTHCLFEQTGERGSWLRRLAYNVGRLGFYVLLGVIAGAGGAILTRATGVGTGLMVLRLLAGLLVIAIGLNLLFNWSSIRFIEEAGANLWRRVSPLARRVLPVTTLPKAFAAGLLWGALPCGLVYSAVALAATSGTIAGGGLTMLAFWIGTTPALLLAGTSAERLARWKSKRLFRQLAGGVMIAVGMLALMPVRMLLN
jgi:sulfite exporter TauE/SafE